MNDLYDEALKAITDLFSDTSVSQAESKRRLNELIGEIQIMVDSLEDEEENV